MVPDLKVRTELFAIFYISAISILIFAFCESSEGECSHWDRSNVYFATYDADDLTGFHRTAPIGSYVTVVNDANKQSVSVRIVAKGPLADGRVMELSPAAFSQVSRLSEVVFDCRVFPPGGTGPSSRPGSGGYQQTGSSVRPGSSGGYQGSGAYQGSSGGYQGSSGQDYQGSGGYSEYGSGGYNSGSGFPTITGVFGTYPGSGSMGGILGGSSGSGGHTSYPSTSGGVYTGSVRPLGGGYDSLDSGSGTLNPGFGPPPVLNGGSGGKHNPLHKQNYRNEECNC